MRHTKSNSWQPKAKCHSNHSATNVTRIQERARQSDAYGAAARMLRGSMAAWQHGIMSHASFYGVAAMPCHAMRLRCSYVRAALIGLFHRDEPTTNACICSAHTQFPFSRCFVGVKCPLFPSTKRR